MLILDEATSVLDDLTEQAVMEAVKAKGTFRELTKGNVEFRKMANGIE